MIVAFSTSSPVVSVAFIAGPQVWSTSREVPRAASGACLEMLEQLLREANAELDHVEEFVADVGPGSFIGVRVAVMLAKTLAMTQGVMVRGVTSFDLISPSETVAFPSRKGEWFVRTPGEVPTRAVEIPPEVVGYGLEGIEPTYPHAERVLALLNCAPRMRPEDLRPEPLMEPSISTPKVPYRRADG